MVAVEFWTDFWDIIWWFVWAFVFIAYLFALFSIITDLFRDRDLSGWWKAVWLVCLLVVPFLTALVYLIARGRGMAERSARAAVSARKASDAYIRDVAGSSSPGQQIAQAKALLDEGAISPDEFASLKAHALRQAGGVPVTADGNGAHRAPA
ncbi:membrane protein [Cellulomonas pakistanensis]|uniref:Membrane protein n=1 Tax=Cellulomonas pakistanensis TaxID=992287 RepID=A0A919P5V7_9CELL|nr:membrane protein [Cellulomonas pakistanensis]